MIIISHVCDRFPEDYFYPAVRVFSQHATEIVTAIGGVKLQNFSSSPPPVSQRGEGHSELVKEAGYRHQPEIQP